MNGHKLNQSKIRARLNAIQDEYGELYFDLREENAKLMDWIILMHMDIQKILAFLNDRDYV